jgi:putative ABC transport system permease protein
VVISQAVIMALMGFVPGWLIATGLYAVTRNITHLSIEMSAFRLLMVLFMTVCVCVASAIGANRKLRQAAPADLF